MSESRPSYETVASPQGNGTIKGYLVRPGERRHTRSDAVEIARNYRGPRKPRIESPYRGHRAAARAGELHGIRAGRAYVSGRISRATIIRGGQLFTKVDGKKMFEDFVACAAWLKSRPDCTGKIGATGFCYGGGVSNNLAVRLGPDLGAAVPFYGAVPPPDDIPKIKAAILVHHGELDTRLAATWPAYDKALTAAGVPHEGYIYPGRRSRLQLRRHA